MKTVGVLALQGGFDAHIRTLKKIGVSCDAVTTLNQIADVSALVIPGGESTTIGKLLVQHGMIEGLRDLITEGLPLFGTCAGMILMSKEAQNYTQPLLGVMDISVERNAYGRQNASFETRLDFNGDHLPALFIRAPKTVSMGKEVSALIYFEDKPVLLRQNKLLAASFHPELTDSTVIHEYFLQLAGF